MGLELGRERMLYYLSSTEIQWAFKQANYFLKEVFEVENALHHESESELLLVTRQMTFIH